MTYLTQRELNRLVLDHLFGLATQQPIQEARRCGPQRASQIVGETIHKATGHQQRHRNNPAMVAFLLARREDSPGIDTPEWFYWHERKLTDQFGNDD